MTVKDIENKTENTKNKTENTKNKTENTKKEEKTIKVKIPISELNPGDKEIIVGINEKYAKIIRGEETEVSLPVYEQLKNAGLV